MAKPADDDFLSAMIQLAVEKQVPIFEKLKTEIARVEQRAGISVRNHLGFGQIAGTQIKYLKTKDYDYIGEININNQPHGRGIEIGNDCSIIIAYRKNGDGAAGKFININSDGAFEVGDVYEDANGKLK